MCNFFSLDSDGKGKIYYFDHEIRKKILSGKLDYSLDSHTSIADYFGFKGEKEDTLNKYEYNPLTKEFQIDRLNTTDDSTKVKKLCNKLDFKTIVPGLIVKPIIHPFKDRNRKRVTKKDIELLKQWYSVRDSVRDSVWYSAWDSVGNSVWDSVGNSVRDSVGNSVWDSVRYSVGNSVWDSVRDSVRDSIWDSVYAYISSFFNLKKWKYIEHKKGQNPFQSVIDLWEKGLVSSFNGKLWRLHGGKNADVLWEGELR